MFWNLFTKIPVLLYDLFISKFFTVCAHLIAIHHITHLSGSFLDVGCGTGAPLQKIISTLKEHYGKIVGVDMHPQYTKEAQKLFEKEDKVSIYEMNFYDIRSLKEKFNFIFFSFSFMLMPDQVHAIQIAKSVLQEEGRVGFLLTLNKKQNMLLQKAKPLIKKLTSIDFGNVVYEKQFDEILSIGGLEIEKKVRVENRYNPLLKLFPVYYVEAKKKQETGV